MLYLIVTERGYWGTGKTIHEAAKNANIGGSFVKGYMVRVDDAIAERLCCTDMGGWSFHYKDHVMDRLPRGDDDKILAAITRMTEFTHIGFSFQGKRLRVIFDPAEETTTEEKK